MDVREIATGLWRWTASHPAWTIEDDAPDGWPRMVGSVYYEPQAVDAEAIVLIDPLAPPSDTPDAEKFWRALDRDAERRGLPVAVLIGNEFHGRSARDVHRRYAGRWGVEIWVPAEALGRIELGVQPLQTFEPGDLLPAAVVPRFVEGLVDPEVAFFIEERKTLVVADAVIGAGSGLLRLSPESWGVKTATGRERYRAVFRDSVRELLDLDFDRVLTSHGEPVLKGGRDALAAALEAPAWGERADG